MKIKGDAGHHNTFTEINIAHVENVNPEAKTVINHFNVGSDEPQHQKRLVISPDLVHKIVAVNDWLIVHTLDVAPGQEADELTAKIVNGEINLEPWPELKKIMEQ